METPSLKLNPLKDDIWNAFLDTGTFEEFTSKFLHPIYLNPQVPEEIEVLINQVKKLLNHSYFEYEFIDIAVVQLAFAFEKALRIKWKDITKKETKRDLKFLIDWFHHKNYFESYNKERVDQIRWIRNGKVHSPVFTLGGVAFLQKIYNIIDFINDLYEDVDLRAIRKFQLELINKFLQNKDHEGLCISVNNQEHLLFTAFALFINNKGNQETVYLSVCPLFNFFTYKEDSFACPSNFVFEIKDWSLQSDLFVGKQNGTGALIQIYPVTADKQVQQFNNWWNNFGKLKEVPMITFQITEPYNNLFVKYQRELHKIV